MSLAVGLVGAGVMGAEHGRILHDATRGAHLAAVADADTAKARAAARGARVFAEAEAMIADPAIEAVLIAAPDALHGQLVLACLAAGKPVLCEKPLAATSEEGLKLVQAEAALGRRLIQVGYNRRFDPGYLAMKAAVAAGEIGAPVLLHNTHRNASAPPWFVGAMPITNSLVHELDISRWLLEAELTSATLHGGPDGDPFLVVMQADTGVVISNEIYMNAAYGYHVEAEIVGRSGSLRLTQPARLTKNADRAHAYAYPDNWVPRFVEAYVAQTNAWVQSVKSGEPVGASAWDGYVATALAEQIVPALTQPGPHALHLPERPALYRMTQK